MQRTTVNIIVSIVGYLVMVFAVLMNLPTLQVGTVFSVIVFFMVTWLLLDDDRIKEISYDRSRCKVCGNPSLSKSWSVDLGHYRFCSFKCSLVGSRKFSLFIGVFLLLVMFLFDFTRAIIYFFIGLMFVVFAISGYELDSNALRSKFKVQEDPGTGSSSSRYHPYQSILPASSNKVTQQPSSSVRTTMYVKELGREVNICCYQTARLQEKYCRCGKGIDDELLQHVT